MLIRSVVVLTSLATLFLAYMFFRPIHESMEDQWVYRTLGVTVTLFHTTSVIAAKLTGCSPAIVFRALADVFVPSMTENPEVEMEDFMFDGVEVRLYKPKSLKVPSPCVVVTHGGGWIMLDSDSYDGTCVNLALKANLRVVNINYRRAPENPYPTPLEDCVRATKYILQHGEKHGIDVQRVAILGESAGGNLATATALKLSEENPETMPPLRAQVLIYPSTQVVNFRTPSYLIYKDYPVNPQSTMALYASFYLLQNSSDEIVQAMIENRHLTPSIRRPIYDKYFKKEYIPDYVLAKEQDGKTDPFDDQVDEVLAQKMDTTAVSPFASPLLSPNLSKLPPTYILVCEFDVLRDDGLLYATRLQQTGVKVNLTYAKHKSHSLMFIQHVSMINYKGAIEEWDRIFTYLKDNF